MTPRPRTPSDRRTCWDCRRTFILQGVDDIHRVDREALRCGWRYLELGGRMICGECQMTRRYRDLIRQRQA